MRIFPLLLLTFVSGCGPIDACLDSGGAWDEATEECLCINDSGEEYTAIKEAKNGKNICD